MMSLTLLLSTEKLRVNFYCFKFSICIRFFKVLIKANVNICDELNVSDVNRNYIWSLAMFT